MRQARRLLRIKYGEDSLPCGNNYLAIARMFKTTGHTDDARSNYYQAIDRFSNALSDAESKNSRNQSVARASLADALDELADYLYNLIYTRKYYGTIDIPTNQVDIEVSKLRARAQRVRAEE